MHRFQLAIAGQTVQSQRPFDADFDQIHLRRVEQHRLGGEAVAHQPAVIQPARRTQAQVILMFGLHIAPAQFIDIAQHVVKNRPHDFCCGLAVQLVQRLMQDRLGFSQQPQFVITAAGPRGGALAQRRLGPFIHK